MFPPQILDNRSLPTMLERIGVTPGLDRERPGGRGDTRGPGTSAPVQGREPGLQLVRPRLTALRASESVLGAREFGRCLERERSLADRGTRRFSLLVLNRRPGERGKRGARAALAELARQACRRLRSTDLVGRMDADCLEILLTDTEPAGAQVVAAWLQRAEARLGLQLEATIYVYPTVDEPEPDDDSFPAAGSNGRTNRLASRRGDGAASPQTTLAELAPVRELGRHEATLARAKRWPQADLWPQLGAPMPRWKRALDVLISAVALLLLAPLFALLAVAIRLDSAGPVIFRQQRAGRGARPFVFYKFRSMVADAEGGRAALAARNEQSGPIFKMQDDPRVTRVGSWLRRSSIDELPQLWNVLKGDISLVGPRSPTFDEVAKYERWQRRRLSVMGGITCIWQVSGRSQIPFREWMRLDMRYVARRNVWLDLRLLVLTLPAVISGRGAC